MSAVTQASTPDLASAQAAQGRAAAEAVAALTPAPVRPRADLDLGLVRIRGMELAVPLEALREVVPCPAQLTPLPAPAPALLGGMNLRGLVLPVLDGRVALGGAPGDAADPGEATVVVVADGGHLVGLLTQGVSGLVRIAPGQVTPVTVTAGELLVSHVFLHPETQTPVSVLSTAALLALPGVPLVPDVGRSSLDAVTQGALASDGVPAGGGPTRTLVTIDCAGFRFALGVDDLHTTIPACRPEPSVLVGPVCRGVVTFNGAKVPVADPLALLGLGRMTPDDMAAGVVLSTGGGYVVLAVSELVDLVPARESDIMAVAAGAVSAPHLVRGIVASGEGTLLIDGPALLADETIRALASVNTGTGGEPTDAGAPRAGSPVAQEGSAAARAGGVLGAGDSYLVYSVGADVATRLDQIQEVLPFAGHLVSTSAAGPGLGVLLHRDTAVPVLDLGRELGLAPVAEGDGAAGEPDLRCLLVVRVGDGDVAFLVETLRSIEPLAWREEAESGAPGHSGDVLPGAPDAPLVRVGASARLLSEVDLRALAARAGLC